MKSNSFSVSFYSNPPKRVLSFAKDMGVTSGSRSANGYVSFICSNSDNAFLFLYANAARDAAPTTAELRTRIFFIICSPYRLVVPSKIGRCIVTLPKACQLMKAEHILANAYYISI